MVWGIIALKSGGMSKACRVPSKKSEMWRTQKTRKVRQSFLQSATGIEPSLEPPEIGLILEISFISYPKQARTTQYDDLHILLSNIWRENKFENQD